MRLSPVEYSRVREAALAEGLAKLAARFGKRFREARYIDSRGEFSLNIKESPMATIRFSFQGYITTEVTTAYHLGDGKDIDVSTWTADEIVKALKAGTIALSMSKSYDNATDDSNCEMFDYEKA